MKLHMSTCPMCIGCAMSSLVQPGAHMFIHMLVHMSVHMSAHMSVHMSAGQSSLGLLKISPGRRRGRFTLSSTDILHLECSIFFFQPIGAVSFDLRLNLRI